MARMKSASIQPPIPVAPSGVMFGETKTPKGEAISRPPASGAPSLRVWQPAHPDIANR